MTINRSTIARILYPNVDVSVDAIKWGPSWGEMKQGIGWLAHYGIPYTFDERDLFSSDEELGLPVLTIYTPHWDPRIVRVGHYIVSHGKGFFDGRTSFDVLDPQEYRYRYDTNEPYSTYVPEALL